MSAHGKESHPPPPPVNPPRGVAPDESLTLKDYLETATAASNRTRFITIIMVVASVLLMVSVLDSWDKGWMTLRLEALGHTTSKYTLEKFPLLCRCDPQVEATAESKKFCGELQGRYREEGIYDKNFWTIDWIDGDLARLKNEADKGVELEAKQKERQEFCKGEKEKLKTFHDAILRSVIDTKYSVRLPFFGVALDVNDMGLLGGLSLCIILILLRLSLRSQIVSLRIGFKAARDSGHARWFYEILATRQMFVFPFLKDEYQSASVAVGWTEALWRKSTPGKFYQVLKRQMALALGRMKSDINARLKPRKELPPGDEAKAVGGAGIVKDLDYAEELQDASEDDDGWRVNRNVSLRIVPKFLCLLPFIIYSTQFSYDFETRHYGEYLNEGRMRWLLRTDAFFLLAILGFGLWCMAKWNELDKLWDYFKDWESDPETPQPLAAETERADAPPVNKRLGAPGKVSETPDSDPPSNPTTTARR